MNDQQLSQAMKNAIDKRLSGLEGDPWLARRIINAEKGDTPVMKKKLSVSLIFILIFTLLTLGAAAALVHSRIADHLYGEDTQAPEEVVSQILHPQRTATDALGALTLDEIYYDGSALHTVIILSNPTDEALLYTVDGFFINGMGASGSNLLSEGPGSYGKMLGGTVDGHSMPQSSTYYEAWQRTALTDADGKFLGWKDIPGGKITLKILMDVWRPLNTPHLVNYDDFEGHDVSSSLPYLITDENGDCNLELFRPESARRTYTLGQSGGAVYQSVFRELGWAERIDTIVLEMEVDLDQIAVSCAVPEKMDYTLQGMHITFDSFELTHTGGSVDGWIAGNPEKARAFLQKGLVLVDRQGDRELSRGCIWDSQPDEEKGIRFTLLLSPIAGDLPDTVYLAQPIAYNDQFVKEYPHYDPSLEKPENIIGTWELDFDRALEIRLNIIR